MRSVSTAVVHHVNGDRKNLPPNVHLVCLDVWVGVANGIQVEDGMIPHIWAEQNETRHHPVREPSAVRSYKWVVHNRCVVAYFGKESKN